MSQRSGRLRRGPGCAGQARRGRGLEGSGTSVETNIMNRIQAPVTGNNKNAASYEQKTMAGADMEEVAGRKELEAHWVRVCDRLRKEIGDKAFKTWFGEVEPGDLKAGKVRLYAPPRFVRDWVSRHYGDRVLAYWQSVDKDVT